LIFALSLITAGFFLFIIGAAIKARERPVVSGQEEMLHASGEVLDDFEGKGRIRIHGEIWLAESATSLRRGDKVQVVAIDGLVLKVQPHNQEA